MEVFKILDQEIWQISEISELKNSNKKKFDNDPKWFYKTWKKYKKDLAFKKKINPMKGWTSKAMDEVFKTTL